MMDNTTFIKVDNTQFEVPTPVANRMQDYYDTYTLATNEYNKLLALTKKVRALQSRYFKSRDNMDLRASKAAEKELDDYLEGKVSKTKEAAQQELFR